jgi:phasin family protein
MAENRVVDEARRVTQESADQAKRVGREYQRAAQNSFDAAGQTFAEANRGFQILAAEVTNYSKKSWEDVLQAWEQLLSARSLPDLIDVQTRYAQKSYEGYVSQLSRLTDLYLDWTRNMAQPVEQAIRRSS